MSVMATVGSEALGVPVRASSLCNTRGKPSERLELRRADLQALEGDNRWRMIICLRGEVWVTQERDLEDYVLTAGDMLVVNQRGKVVLGALQEAVVEVTASMRKAPYQGEYHLSP